MELGRMELLMGLHFNGWLQAFPANIILWRKTMAAANTLAYYKSTTITAIKSFIAQDPG
jgi:hypothetical protein